MIRLSDVAEIASAPGQGDDEHGNPTPDWASAAWSREPALIQPVSSSENNAAQDTVISRWRIFLLPVTAATSLSRVRWRGDVYEVDGEVQVFPDLRAKPHHHEAFLRRVEG